MAIRGHWIYVFSGQWKGDEGLNNNNNVSLILKVINSFWKHLKSTFSTTPLSLIAAPLQEIPLE